MGAAIAAGSQAEKGIWALLVIPAIVTRAQTKMEISLGLKKIKFQEPIVKSNPILIKIQTSPIRFLKTVSIPALQELSFW